jgi:hypothetical protein
VIAQSNAHSQRQPGVLAVCTAVGQAGRASSEDKRIELLIQRDGRDAATAWIKRTLNIYRQALSDPRSYVLLPQYRPLFEESIGTFACWLKSHDQPEDQ